MKFLPRPLLKEAYNYRQGFVPIMNIPFSRAAMVKLVLIKIQGVNDTFYSGF